MSSTTSLPRSLGLQLSSRILNRTAYPHAFHSRSLAPCCRQLRQLHQKTAPGAPSPSPLPHSSFSSSFRSCSSATPLIVTPSKPSPRSSLARHPAVLDAFARLCRSQSTLTAAATGSSSYSSLSSSTSASASSSTPYVTRPVVAVHLYALAFLVYAIIVVGGLTRLTESGLSITEWNPGFKGMRLPLTRSEWEAEWDKYKQTPEFHLLNSRMSLDDFKSIYMWEWGHRILGRIIGVAFVLPAGYFIAKRWVAPGTRVKLVGIALGIGFQGFLGWFMVKSGLTAPEPSGRQKTVTIPVPAAIRDDQPNSTATVTVPSSSAQSSVVAPADWTPRVSHFRLAMHMGTAFLVYLAMLHTGLSVTRDYKVAQSEGTVAGVKLSSGGGAGRATLERLANTLNHPLVRHHSRLTKFVTALVFTTAMSGALVAGLDAGLVYNEFPTMGDGRIAPPLEELIDERFARNEDGSDKVWRNVLQNPVTVQLVHRTLAVTTLLTVYALAWKTHRVARRYGSVVAAEEVKGGVQSAAAVARVARSSSTVPRVTPVAASNVGGVQGGKLLDRFPRTPLLLAYAAAGVATMQATLGITTLLYLVPIPLASAHQAGAVALLSVLVAMTASMRRIPKQLVWNWAKSQARKQGGKGC
ncbi:Cytochrome c oxidase assembly protein cox15 [Thecaphora frezii]